MTDRREHTVAEQSRGKRLDQLLVDAFGVSRAKAKALIDEGAVRVDGRRLRKGDRVEPGQRIALDVEPEPEGGAGVVPEPEAPLSVLHQDEALVFVDKPAGVPSHPLRPGERGTVANALVARFAECALAAEDPREGGLCHRLDTGTSGVLLAARTPAAWRAVRDAFTAQAVDKRYLALVTGPLADEGEISVRLRHAPRHADRVEPALGDEGREARSVFRVVARKGEYALVEVRIFTGVLHQVRAHLAAVGAPLVGDALYHGRPDDAVGRTFLHARSLSLPHPITGQTVRVESPLPPELKAALERLDLPV